MENSTKQVVPDSSKVELAVIMVNYKTPKFIEDCLTTLLPELEGLDAKVVLVDNKSPDNSVAQIKDWLTKADPESKVQLLESPKNGGFAAGNNLGINAIKADKYLLLNSDTLVRPGSIGQLLKTSTDFPDAGLYSPRLEWPDGAGQESCFVFPTPLSEFMRAAQTGVFDRLLRKYVIAMPVQTDIASPDWTSFACVMVRAEVFEQVGLLDEGYFMYFEDIEFCHRARRSGWQIIHNPEARVVHLRGGSSPVKERTRQKKRLPDYYYESRARFMYQTYGYSGLLAANILWSFGRSISKCRQLLGRSDKAAVQRQWADIWKNFFQPLRPYTHPES